MSEQETPDNVVEFRRKPKTEKPEKRARAAAIDPGLNINTSENLVPGDNVMCRVVKYVPGGFNVIIIPQNLPAYLPSNSNHQAGDQIPVIFVAAEKNRLLLSQRPASSAPDRSKLPDPGENLNCKIIRPEEGGYEVFLAKYNCAAYLPTQSIYRPGDELVTTFVCVNNQRFMVAERFSPDRNES